MKDSHRDKKHRANRPILFRPFRLTASASSSCLLSAIVGLASVTAACAQPTNETQTSKPAAPLELRYTTVPRAPDDLRRSVALLDAELAALAPTTQPTTSQPTTHPNGPPAAQLDGWRQELWKSIEDFRNELQELEKQLVAVALLSKDSQLAKLTDEIADWKRKTSAVRHQELPGYITDATIAEARALYDQNNQIIDALSATWSQQDAMLRDGFAAQRLKLDAELKSAQTVREGIEATAEVDAKAAQNDVGREIVEARRRVAAARLAALETARTIIEIKEKRTQQEMEQNKLRRDAMHPYVVALRERMNAMIEAKSATSVEWLRKRIDDPDLSPMTRAFYRLELVRDENVARLQKEYANAIRDRFPTSALAALESSVHRDRRYWQEFSESLPRRSSSDVLTAYRMAGTELTQANQRLAGQVALLDLSFIEERKIEKLSSKAMDEFHTLEAQFRELASARSDEEAIKRMQQVGQFRLELRNAFDEMLILEQGTVERLRAAVGLGQANLALWEEASSRLYWAHLITRGPTILDSDIFKTAETECIELYHGRLSKTLKDSGDTIRGRLKVLTMVDGLVLVFSTLGAVYGGYRLARKCARIRREAIEAVAAPRDEEPSPPTFGQRLRFHSARVGVVIVPILFAGALLEIFIRTVGLTGQLAAIARALVGLLCGSAASFALLNGALKAAKPRFRLIPCSTTVSRYYRRYGYTLIILALLLMGPAILLRALELAPNLVEQLKSWFVFVATGLSLAFMVRRETVLNIFPRAQRGRLAAIVATLRATHPTAIVVVLSLLVMHLIGYKALAIYITVGLASTIAFILAAMLLYQLQKEFLLWCVKRVRKMHATYESAQSANAKSGEPDVKLENAEAVSRPTGVSADQTPPLVRAVITTVRWALVAAVLVAALSIWGIRPYEIKRILDLELWHHGENAITLWRIGGSILALFVAVIISRTVRQALNARLYPRHKSIDRGAQAAIDTLLHYLIVAIGVYVGLQTLRLDFGALVVLFGGLGLGIGLGLQPLIVNFVSGLFMLFERHVKVGDVVIVHDKLGEVTKVSMRSTTIRTPDGIYLIIPNGEFINEKVENWTLEGKPIRGMVDVGVSYAADPKRVKELLLEIAFAEPKVLMDPQPDVFFTNFGDNSLNFSLACWFRNPAERWFGMLSLRYTITDKFRENNIEIPFPQRTLSLMGDKPLRIAWEGGPPTRRSRSETDVDFQSTPTGMPDPNR